MSYDALSFLIVPFIACLILVGIHAYLGIHVLARGVIFVDIALAQIAALGTTTAMLMGHEPDTTTAYLYSLGFTFIGAALFALSRDIRERVPQEAIIGITYAVSSALAILLVDNVPHGIEHIKSILIGNILWVTPRHVGFVALLYGTIGLIHYLLRKRFLDMSFNHDSPLNRGRQAMFWDLIFYMTFGFVITSSVQMAGVLLVFSFLIVPAVISAMFSRNVLSRLLIGWSTGFIVCVVGIWGSYSLDLPTGAAVVATFGIAVLLSIAARVVMNRMSENLQEARDREGEPAP